MPPITKSVYTPTTSSSRVIESSSGVTGSIPGYSSSSDLILKTPRALIHSPPGLGKTFCSLTASTCWPDDLASAVGVSLDDTFFIQIDHGALDGLVEYDITLP